MHKILIHKNLLWLVGLGALLLASLSLAQSPVGEVASLTGTPERIRDDTASLLSLGQELLASDEIRTDENSEVVLAMLDGTRLSIDRDSRVAIQAYLPGGQSAELGVIRGRLRSVVSESFSRRRNAFRVRTSTAVVGVQGTDFLVETFAESSRITVYEGLVEVINADPAVRGSQQLSRRQTVLVRRSESPPSPTNLDTTGQAQPSNLDLGSGGDTDRRFGGAPWVPGSTEVGGVGGGSLPPPPSIIVPADPNLPR